MNDEMLLETLRNEARSWPDAPAGFSRRVMEGIRREKSGGAPPEELKPQSVRPFGPRLILAATVLIALGALTVALSPWSPRGAEPGPAEGGLARDSASGALLEARSLGPSAGETSVRDGALGPRASRLRRSLGKMIEFQDDDGAWSRVTASGLPLDQVGLSALAFKTFVRLGGGESEPDRARRAMDFLLKRQRPDGSFSSSLLTTAVVVTALDEAAILGGEPALADTIDRGRRFLRRHRGADGSWSSGSGSERDDLLTTAFAARALGVGDGRLVASLRRKTEAILREARSLDGNEIDIRLALCLASRVSAGEDPTAPELEEPARVLFDRFTDGTDPLGLYFKGVFASTRGGEEWLRIQDQIEANQGMGTSAPEIDLIEILALVLLEGRG